MNSFKERLIKLFLLFFATLSGMDFRTFLRTARRQLSVNRRILILFGGF